jgi:hypothetical protein
MRHGKSLILHPVNCNWLLGVLGPCCQTCPRAGPGLARPTPDRVKVSAPRVAVGGAGAVALYALCSRALCETDLP